MADDRVFHTSDGFQALYNKEGAHLASIPSELQLSHWLASVAFEIATTGAWCDSGPRTIMEQIPAKLRRGGWDVVRPAVSVTAR